MTSLLVHCRLCWSSCNRPSCAADTCGSPFARERNSSGSHGTSGSLDTLALTRTGPRRASGLAGNRAASELCETAATSTAPKSSTATAVACTLQCASAVHRAKVSRTKFAQQRHVRTLLARQFACVSGRGAEESLRAQCKPVMAAGGLEEMLAASSTTNRVHCTSAQRHHCCLPRSHAVVEDGKAKGTQKGSPVTTKLYTAARQQVRNKKKAQTCGNRHKRK